MCWAKLCVEWGRAFAPPPAFSRLQKSAAFYCHQIPEFAGMAAAKGCVNPMAASMALLGLWPSLTRPAATQIAGCVVGLIFFGIGVPAVAQENTALRESPVMEPITTEESLPEDAGECNLRTTAAYHARALEPMAAVQLFCGFSPRWGGEIEVPIVRVDGRYGPGEVGATVK
jgi:hypothetical protein